MPILGTMIVNQCPQIAQAPLANLCAPVKRDTDVYMTTLLYVKVGILLYSVSTELT